MNSKTSEKLLCEKAKRILMAAHLPSNCIRTEYRTWLDSQYPTCSDIAIVDSDGIPIVVFEIKENPCTSVCETKAHGLAKYGIHTYVISAGSDGELYLHKFGDKKAPVLFDSRLAEIICANPSQVDKENITNIASYLKTLNRVRLKQNLRIGGAKKSISEEERPFKFFFRGQSDESWLLRPSLFREIVDGEGGTIETATYYTEELALIFEAQRAFPDLFSKCNSDIDNMTVAQHYGIPTRLLDVTGNALVALYFAVCENKNIDGSVYIFRTSARDFRDALRCGQQDKCISIGRYHDKKTETKYCKPILVFPAFLSQRQRMQDGSFFLMKNHGNPLVIDDFPEDGYDKLTIPARFKDTIHAELAETCNIHRGTLFPESLTDYKDKFIADAKARISLLSNVGMEGVRR